MFAKVAPITGWHPLCPNPRWVVFVCIAQGICAHCPLCPDPSSPGLPHGWLLRSFQLCSDVTLAGKPLRITHEISPGSPSHQGSLAAGPAVFFSVAHLTLQRTTHAHVLLSLSPNVRSVKAGALSVLLTPMNSAWH